DKYDEFFCQPQRPFHHAMTTDDRPDTPAEPPTTYDEPSEATPASLGYRMPAEWEPHEGTWIAWPHNREDWPGKFGPVPWVYTEIVRLLSRVEAVNILVKGRKMQRRAADRLDAAGVDPANVHFVKAATDRVWTRDSGPTFVVNDRAGT